MVPTILERKIKPRCKAYLKSEEQTCCSNEEPNRDKDGEEYKGQMLEQIKA